MNKLGSQKTLLSFCDSSWEHYSRVGENKRVRWRISPFRLCLANKTGFQTPLPVVAVADLQLPGTTFPACYSPMKELMLTGPLAVRPTWEASGYSTHTSSLLGSRKASEAHLPPFLTHINSPDPTAT